MRELNIEKETERVVQFIKNKVTGSGFTKAIIGLSGGIDSALSAALAVKALGKENVIGVMMPYKSSNPDSLEHALILFLLLILPQWSMLI